MDCLSQYLINGSQPLCISMHSDGSISSAFPLHHNNYDLQAIVTTTYHTQMLKGNK